MTENDYVILVDENGTPYIAHAFGDRIKTAINRRKNHKYIQRFDNYWGPGKHAYAYTNAEVKLYSAGRRAKNAVKDTAKKAAKYVDDHDAGLTEAIQARSARRKKNRAIKTGDTQGIAEYARQEGRLREQSRQERNAAANTIRHYGNTALSAVKNTGRKAGRFIDEHDLGLTEAIEANAARRKKNRAIKTGDTQGIVDYTRQEARLREEGRKERENAIKGVKNAARSATEDVKNAGRSAANATRNIGNQVNGQIKNVQNAIDNKLDQVKAGRIAKQHERRLAEIKDYMDEIAEAKEAFENGDPKALRELQNAVESVSDRLGGVQTVLTKSDLNAIESFLDGVEEYLARGYDAEDRRGNVH